VGHAGARDGDGSAPPALLAIDKATGRTLGEIELPGVPNGTPMTYVVDGRQMVVVAVNTDRDAQLVAVALR
jgi:quinoprotein glucose dehydrogenase